MNPDISRSTFKKHRRYSRVIMQQGRPLLDADFNEQADILLDGMRELAGAVFGPCCALEENAFALTRADAPDGKPGFDFYVESGRIVVDGVICESPPDTGNLVPTEGRFRYSDQFAKGEKRTSFEPGWYLVYLEVWDRPITHEMNPGIRDVALGGADTAARSAVSWLVRVAPNSIGATHAAVLSRIQQRQTQSNQPPTETPEQQGFNLLMKDVIEPRARRGCAAFSFLDRADVSEPNAGYFGLENQLIRVEVHDAPDDPPKGLVTLKWSSGNVASCFAGEIVDGGFKLSVADRIDPTFPVANDTVELLTEYQERRHRPGIIGIIKSVDQPNSKCEVTLPADAGLGRGRGFLRTWRGVRTIEIKEFKDDKFWVRLDDGIGVQLNPSDPYLPGDYWLLPLRVGLALPLDIRQKRTPDGPDYRRAPLGLIHLIRPAVDQPEKVDDVMILRPVYARRNSLTWGQRQRQQ